MIILIDSEQEAAV